MNHREEFERCWTKFADRLKGRLLTMSRNAPVAFPAVSELLESERSFWDDQYQEGGHWLRELREENAAKAEVVREILTADMRVKEETAAVPKKLPAQILRTLAGAGVGGALGFFGKLFGGHAAARPWIPVVSALLCAGIAFYLGVSADQAAEEKGRRNLNDAYLRQLDKFKNSVESALADF